MNCAVFASGGGTNFQSLLDRIDSGDLHVKFTVAIGNNSKAYALQRARNKNIPTVHIAPSHFENNDTYTKQLMKVLKDYKVDFIVLAGYMKMLPLEVIQQYENKIINIHPALLPAFGGKGMYGSNVHKAVIEYGVKVSGVTVHLADEHYDHGPIVMQKTLDVQNDDTPESLAERILELEHDTLWRALEAFAQNKITIQGRKAIYND